MANRHNGKNVTAEPPMINERDMGTAVTPADATPLPERKCDHAPIRKRAVLAFLLILPALWTGRLIWRYGVDVPFMDHWDFVCWLLENADAGTLQLSHFTEPFGPHRMFFPRLILFGLAKLTHWNIRAELFLTWLITGICLINLWRLAAVTGLDPRRQGFLPLLAACVLLFTPMQLEVWFSGVEMQYVLTTACLTACLWILPTVRFPINFLLSLVLCLISTFTVASGLTCWLLLAPLLWLHGGARRGRMILALLWLFAFATSLFLYFHRNVYVSPGTNLAGFSHEPFQAIQYFFSFLGGAFGRVPGLAPAVMTQITGGLLVLSLLLATGYLWRFRRDSELVFRALPWLTLASFALANAALTAVGRLELGLAQALSPRYVAGSIMLPIGLLFLVPTIFNHWRDHRPDQRRVGTVKAACFCLAGALGLLHLVSSLNCLADWRKVQHDRLASKALLLVSRVVDEDETLLHATAMNQPGRTNEPALTKGHVLLLDRIGYLRPPLLRTNAIREIIGNTTRAPQQFGEIQHVSRPAQQQIAMTGWAVLPDKRRPADAVFLTYDDPVRGPILFAVGLVDTPRLDLLKTSGLPEYLRQSGWIKTFDPGRLPPGNHRITAWAFDAEASRAYRLNGETSVLATTQ